ncbi:hypothetical protein ABKV35_00120 [Enterobacter kobei]|uniref:hypothetical protein n=1 Tax=Enterobacter kobei TaxID=208224 RepID=UPI0032AF6EA2
MKHTPGPWQWWTSNSFLRLSSQATGKDGDVIDSFKMSDGATSLSVKIADMNLIAAAPDLLKELQRLRDYVINICGVDDGDCDSEHPLMSSMAAISKALGEE